MKIFVFIFVICVAKLQPVMAQETDSRQIEVQALMTGMVVLTIDGSRTTLKPGDELQGVKLISSTTKSARVEIDGVSQILYMGTTVNTHFTQRELITERIVTDNHGMFRGHGSINGQSVKFLIDTGASTVAMSARQARKLGIQYIIEGMPAQASTASGLAKAWVVRFKTVRLGKLLEHNVRGMVVDGDYPEQVLLGMTFLNRMKVEKEGSTMKITRKK